ncbi:response regulator transcription factor [Solirubrobacter phytolaccae]|uniref:Response regulator transcription factor n=1 Tax=Solirubrobacter phytolaccae TaxID=1404360 RepID=A0A9X3NC89_9ACTN|nr:response regulator transcription factor [Solirubrobacter phytolaccae]MDA0183808.1 response regulator transcription factor [Solirubrobacter phytolaccae]
MRVVIADDSLLVREGIASLLRRAGFDVVAEAADGDEAVALVDAHMPDIAIVDIRMPPTHTDEGLRAAHAIRARHPDVAIVILSQHVEAGIAMRLLAETPQRLGYLLKDRVTEIEEFAASLRRVAGGGSALDPKVFERLLAAQRDDGPLGALSAREREVLALVAEGLSNRAIGERLDITEGGVQKHVRAVFTKLGLATGDDAHRRVLAVLTYLSPDGRR